MLTVADQGKERRTTAFDCEHLFSNSVYGHPLHGKYQAATASGLRMQSLSTPRRVYPAKRARLLDAKAKERCDKAVPRSLEYGCTS